jgi:hypothetical protein
MPITFVNLTLAVYRSDIITNSDATYYYYYYYYYY